MQFIPCKESPFKIVFLRAVIAAVPSGLGHMVSSHDLGEEDG